MNQFEMVVLIVAIVMITGVLRSLLGVRRGGKRGDRGERPAVQEDAETRRLRDEVKQLKDRLAVIERITVEKENSLEREIERLRDQ
ncbi:MAG: hypothetical protein QOH47_2096 [Sphingomonadales bacterium]|jgi:uncharacterized protein YlxW (UPF0749 family)|nr:hypothetical protein [Sphingomonadales bacterium]